MKKIVIIRVYEEDRKALKKLKGNNGCLNIPDVIHYLLKITHKRN